MIQELIKEESLDFFKSMIDFEFNDVGCVAIDEILCVSELSSPYIYVDKLTNEECDEFDLEEMVEIAPDTIGSHLAEYASQKYDGGEWGYGWCKRDDNY